MRETKPQPSETQPTHPRKRTKLRWALRQTRRLIVLLGVGLLMFVVGFVLYAWQVNVRGDRAIQEVADMLTDRGLLEYNVKQFEDDDDSYPDEIGTSAAYWRAAMDLRPDQGDRPLPAVALVPYIDPEPCQQYHPDAVTAMREVVKEAALFYDVVEHAGKVKQRPYPFTGTGVSGSIVPTDDV